MAYNDRTGQITTGPKKGWQYQTYRDPASQTGFTRKTWDPNDTSNGGAPTEQFEPFNETAAAYDDQTAQSGAAQAAANAAQVAGRQQADDAKSSAFWQGVQQVNERGYQEGVRQYDQGFGLQQQQQKYTEKSGNRDFDLRNADTRTRMKIGLRQIELQEKQFGAQDQRDRERNVMDYLGTIGKLRLPLTELQALSQRAVQGIIPGAATTGANGTGGAGSTGSLTADQWQALAQGQSRQYENSQIGQGSALSG